MISFKYMSINNSVFGHCELEISSTVIVTKTIWQSLEVLS